MRKRHDRGTVPSVPDSKYRYLPYEHRSSTNKYVYERGGSPIQNVTKEWKKTIKEKTDVPKKLSGEQLTGKVSQ